MHTPQDSPSTPSRQHSSFSGAVQNLLISSVLGPPPRPGLLGRIDHYEILRLLGAGGMGWVFLARDASIAPPDSQVAIKVLKPELAGEPRATAYFLREVRHLQRLTHPHILQVLAVSSARERPYFVMPYMPGGNLGNLLQPSQPLPTHACQRIAREIASALSYAHRRGILHRDVKPTNILLDAQGRAFLTDFGLARTVFNETLVDFQTGSPEGTVAYLSPGAAAGEIEDMRGDIYSFGALLYELLTGHPPYSGQTKEQIRRQILAGPPPPIPTLNAQAPGSLIRIAERAMARRLGDRYASMTELLEDLECPQPIAPTSSRDQPALPRTRSDATHAHSRPARLRAASARLQLILLATATAVAGALALRAWLSLPAQSSKANPTPENQEPSPQPAEAHPTTTPPALATPFSGPDMVFAASFDPDQPLDLFLLRDGDTQATNLTEHFDLEPSSPRFSPDGQRIAFIASSRRSSQLWIANLDGSGKQRVPTPHDAFTPAWHDDDTLYYVCGGTGWAHIYRIKLDGTGYEQVITGSLPGDANNADRPAYSPTADLLAFHAQARSWAPTADIYLAQADGSNPRLHFADADDNTTDRNPVWSEDGCSLFWVRYTKEGDDRPDRGGMIVRKSLSPWTSVREFDQVVRPGAGSMVSLEAVSSDGSTLLLTRDEEEKSLVTHDIVTGKTTVWMRPQRLAGADWRPPPGPVKPERLIPSVL